MKRVILSLVCLFTISGLFAENNETIPALNTSIESTIEFEDEEEEMSFGKRLTQRNAPRFHLGLRAGLTSSSVDDSYSLLSPYGGLAMDWRISPLPIYLESGLYYMNRGFSNHYNYNYDNHSLVIPFTVGYHAYLADNMSLQPSFGVFHSYSLDYETVDFGFRIAIGWNYKRLYLNLGYDIGSSHIEYESAWGYYDTYSGLTTTSFMTIGFNLAGRR